MRAAETSVVLTDHAEHRTARRNIPPDALEYVLTYGRRIQRYSRDLLFLGQARYARADRQVSWVTQLEGTVVFMSGDGAMLTVYRHRKALPTICRKLKYRLPFLNNDYTNYQAR